jgi:hypothetical protein
MLKMIALGSYGINKYQMVEKTDLLNGLPDTEKIDRWITVSKSDLFSGRMDMDKDQYMIFPEYESPREPPW